MTREPDEQHDAYQERVQPLLAQAAGYAHGLVGNRADAEDAVQEALLKGYRGLHGFDTNRSFKCWWFAIVRNCCTDILQQHRSKPRTVNIEQAGHVPAPAAENPEPLREAIATLTPTLREILELRYFGGYSYRELAEALDIPQGTVMSRLHAARLALAAAYGKDQ